MREIKAMRLTEGRVRELFAENEPAVLVFGSAQAARVYALPVGKWGSVIDAVYDSEPAFRLTPRKLKEANIIGLLTHQVDEHLRLSAYGILVVGAHGAGNSYNYTEVAYLVPCSPFWKAKVEGGE